MPIDLIEIASKSERVVERVRRGAPTQFNQERHDAAMAIALSPRDPKYWVEAQQISDKAIKELSIQ